MDLTQLDNLIERLEKKKSLRPGSPPVSINGNLGVWRTVRHNRMFIEIDSKGLPKGRVLIGPPSFVGNKLGDIPDDVWANLTPRSTTKQFANVKVADNGIETLKQSIENAVGPEDTRREALKELNTVEQLVPISRSAGFTDEEIKAALAGNAPNKPLSSGSNKKPETPEPKAEDKPNNVVQLKPRGTKPDKPAAAAVVGGEPLVDKPKAPSEPDKPKSTPTDSPGDFINDALARLPEAVAGTTGDEKNKAVADFLDEVVVPRKAKTNELQARAIKNIANALRVGKMTQGEAEQALRDLASGERSRVKQLDLSPAQSGALEDGAKVKDLIDNLDAKIEEKVNEKINAEKDKFAPKPQTKPEAKPEVSDSRIRELAEETRRRSDEALEDSKRQRREAARLREQAAADRQASQEFMSDAQKSKLEAEAAISLLKELASSIKNPEVKKEIQQVIEAASTGSFNRRSILLRLYQLLQILLLLVPF